tara:strand:+ start:6708 stop:6953 length:246 start_codon:yes stop_codon:yes gene_type:complete
MKRHARKAFTELKKAGCPVKEWHNDSRGHFWIDAEEPEGEDWLDYWKNDIFFGSDRLNSILKENGLYWEWANCAVGHVHDI